jgi:hypothetical protein
MSPSEDRETPRAMDNDERFEAEAAAENEFIEAGRKLMENLDYSQDRLVELIVESLG